MAGEKVAMVWRANVSARGAVLPEPSRLVPIADALRSAGFVPVPVVYCEEASAEVEAELRQCAGVLAWVDPLTAGRNRADLDRMLRAVAAAGVWVGSHPDVILKMGTKEVLFATRELGWSGDVDLYRSVEDFRSRFPARLARDGTRVLKRYRGNGGQGVWRVTALDNGRVRLQEATHRDGAAEDMALDAFLMRCEAYFEDEGRLIDQAFQPRIVDGMVRCYFCGGELIGFARQYPAGYGTALDPANVFGLPAAKTMLPADELALQGLRSKLREAWVPGLQRLLDISEDEMPAIWDADFLFGPKAADGSDTFVLCEINASCITPFPPAAPAKIAQRVTARLRASRRRPAGRSCNRHRPVGRSPCPPE